MNTSFRFLIPTIFLALGFIISCNDDITSAGEEEPDVNNNNPPTTSETPSVSDVPSTPTTTTSTSTSTIDIENTDNFNIDDINPEDLSKKIQEIGEKIEKLEKESKKHFDEYYKMVEVQKGILNEIKRKKKIMRFKPVGSPEQIKAKKDFEDEKKYGKEKLQTLKDKNIILHKLTKSITEARNEKIDLQRKQEYFFKKQKEKENKKLN